MSKFPPIQIWLGLQRAVHIVLPIPGAEHFWESVCEWLVSPSYALIMDHSGGKWVCRID